MGKVGSTVLKDENGTYQTVDMPTDVQVNQAAAVYLGGHVYDVSAGEAEALTTAGYEVAEI